MSIILAFLQHLCMLSFLIPEVQAEEQGLLDEPIGEPEGDPDSFEVPLPLVPPAPSFPLPTCNRRGSSKLSL